MQSPQSELSVCGFISNNKGEDGLAELRRNGMHMLAADLFDIRQPDILYRCKGGCFLGWGGATPCTARSSKMDIDQRVQL